VRLHDCRRADYRLWGKRRSARARGGTYAVRHPQLVWEMKMPVILWLLGVPLTVVILLMLLHVL
jgi:hypothetical protein